MNVEHKIAVVTGGAGGIGSAIVHELIKNRVKFVAIFDLDNPKTRTVVEKLKNDYGERVDLYPCDVSSKTEFTVNFEKVLETFKTIDILINNAGIGGDLRTELMIDINYKAVVLSSLLFINRLGKHKGGKGGVVVNLASIAGTSIMNFIPLYCSTKHAVVSFTRCLDMEQYDVTGVRVVAICPGATNTPIIPDREKYELDFIAAVQHNIPLFTIQEPTFVAESVVKIIEKGKSGNVWGSENNQPPYEIPAVRGVSQD